MNSRELLMSSGVPDFANGASFDVHYANGEFNSIWNNYMQSLEFNK